MAYGSAGRAMSNSPEGHTKCKLLNTKVMSVSLGLCLSSVKGFGFMALAIWLVYISQNTIRHAVVFSKIIACV